MKILQFKLEVTLRLERKDPMKIKNNRKTWVVPMNMWNMSNDGYNINMSNKKTDDINMSNRETELRRRTE